MRQYVKPSLSIGGRRFDWAARTYIMGVINVSPDSFSGDGLATLDAAVAQAQRFAEDGADILDVGGQSTRPGFDELSVDEELRRVVPAIEVIARDIGLPVSVDAYRSPVVEAALNAGATLVNDIWGFRKDRRVAELVSRHKVPAVVMHNQRGRDFNDVIGDIKSGLTETLRIASEAGISKDQLIIDPGFGFGWTVAQNFEMLRRLSELTDLSLPILVGTSRKSSIGAVLGEEDPQQRLWGTAATLAIAIANGADIVRVHDVAEMRQVAMISDVIVR